MSASEMKYVEGLINKMKVIQKLLPPSTPRLLGSGSGQQALSSPGSSSGGASLLLRKRLTPTFLVLLAALVAGLLFLLPGGLLQAQQDNMTTVSFTENGTGPVATFTGTDPEGATPIAWFIAASDSDPDGPLAATDAVDADNFDISKDGALTFDIGGDNDTGDMSVSPDFENPGGEGAASNTYMVVVGACDVELETGACPITGNAGYQKVTVMVTDEDEPGKVTLDTSTANGTPQYLVGATLTANVSDGDITDPTQTFMDDRVGEVTGVTWRWRRGGTEITGAGAQGNTYILQTADAGQHIRAVVYYIVTGNVDQEMAEKTTDYPVLAGRVVANQLEFDPAAVSRTISEGAKGRNVGAPVTATGNHGTVRYSLAVSGDATRFDIDDKTGQITTDVDLDYEGEIEATAEDAGSCAGAADDAPARECTVTVTATDSTGEAATTNATVTIMITDVNEEPAFSTGSQTVSVPENSTVLYGESDDGYSDDALVDVTYEAMDPEGLTVNYSRTGPDRLKFQLSGSPPVLSFVSKPDFEAKASADGDNVYEVTVRASVGGDTGERMVRVTVGNADEGPDVSGPSTRNFAENGEGPVATFTGTDPEGATPITWLLLATGEPGDITAADYADADDFDISKDGVLTFDIGGDNDTGDMSVSPDFENPGGEGAASNTYMVVVGACDVELETGACPITGNAGYQKVTVMVTDGDEPGKVTLDTSTANGTPQYLVGATLTANVSDGDITDPTQTFTADRVGEVTGVTWRWRRGGTEITGAGAQSNTYILQAADANNRIRVDVTYQVGENTNQESASLTTAYPVLAARVVDNQLEFDPAAVSRTISEGAKGRNVGARVTATGNHGTVRYSLAVSGDATRFDIDDKTGQITTDVDLDYEGEIEATAEDAGSCAGAADDAPARECTVTVTATDSTGEAATTNATVTIMITDVDEESAFITGSQTVSVPENSTVLYGESDDGYSDDALVDITYEAMDPEGLTVNYSLTGPDRLKFQLSGSPPVLSFVSKPDFEAKASADGDNVYEVTVRASVGGDTGERMVRVTVGNVDEGPEIIQAGLLISGPSSADFSEGDMDAVAMFTATGPMKDMASWTLEGDDRMYFRVGTARGAMTELMFRSAPDYEMPRGMAMSDANTNTYMVTLKADDRTYMDTHDVMVMVTNVDEIGTLSGPDTVSDYMENGTDAVGTYTVSGGSMSEMANLTLMGDDAGDFTISDGGMLRFMSSPNYEMPMDADTDNTYMVTVKAEVGGEMTTHPVTVMVTNVDDPGTVTLWVGTDPLTGPAVVGEALTGLVVDSDGSVTDQSWQWMKADSAAGPFADITGATSASYTPVEADASMFIKVMATYTDAEGSGKTAESSPSVMVQTVAAPMTLLQRYAGEDGILQLDEVFVGIDEYFDQTGPITLEEVYELIDLYFDQG